MCPTPCIGDGHPTFDRETLNWYINPYYGVDHPLKQWQFRPQHKGVSTSMVWIFDIFCLSDWQNDFYALISTKNGTKNKLWLALQAVPYHLLFGFFYFATFSPFSPCSPGFCSVCPAGVLFLLWQTRSANCLKPWCSEARICALKSWSLELRDFGAKVPGTILPQQCNF